MITITSLPEELLLFIIDYACERVDPCSAFASVNRSLSTTLLRKARRIFISTTNRKWKSAEKRAKLLRMINVPSRQLCFNIGKYSNATSSSLLSEVGSFYWLVDSTSAVLTRTNSSPLDVKHLELCDVTDIESFDIFPSVESLHLRVGNKLKIETLNLPAYPLLRFLKLSCCSSVKDVSCLDGIHSLELCSCANITDISPLNNNYRVRILHCEGITTYSKSFRYTHYLEIVDLHPKDIVSLDSCLHLSSLSVLSKMGINKFDINLLVILSIKDILNLAVLPPNRLQKVSIIWCDNFNSLDNMDHIRSIHLEGLNHITTLTGLGPKNQIITLRDMKQLEDISALKEAQSVAISNCPLLFHSNKLSCLTSVNELHLYRGFGLSIPTLTFLLCLSDLHSLVKLNALELWVYSSFSETENELLRFLLLHTLKNIEKIYLQGIDFNSMNNEDIQNEFNVVVVKGRGPRKAILLREGVTSV